MSCRHVFDDGKGCKKSAIYNLADLYPAYCKDHKTDEMVNVHSVRCDYVSESGVPCKKTVSWGYPDTKKKVRCAEHKLDGMKDLKHPSCLECDSPCCYGFITDKSATYCAKHKKVGMVNLKHKMCEECERTREPTDVLIASYNYNGESGGRFCKDHQLDGMVDVTHQRCVFKDGDKECKQRRMYNFSKGDKPLFCKYHKTNGMIDVSNKMCEFGPCVHKASYNIPTEIKPRFCSDHKTAEMINIKGTKCANEWCDNRFQTNKNENYCIRCYVHMFPDKPNARNYKTKEKAVCDFILETFSDMTWVSDKRVRDGCSRRRPDLLLDLGYQVIIVEVDENQHMDYDCSCENKRLMELSKDVGHRSIIFIRFNPDDYQDRDDNKVKSCWSINKTNGLSVITKKNSAEWSKRLRCLQQQVQYWIDNKTDKTIETVQLFYDEC
jgi:EsV-1-7 cysteine-rich motif